MTTPDDAARRRAEAIVDAFVDKCDKVHPDGSTSEDYERDLVQPIAAALATERKAGADAMRETLAQLKEWMEQDSVAGTGAYDRGMMCGVEDRGYQKDGYSAMRYGYDRALERVSEYINPLIAEAIDKLPDAPAADTVRVPREPDTKWLQRVAVLARLWPAHDVDGVPLPFLQTIQKHHKAMIDAAAGEGAK